jgi:hypothetical protein
LQADRDIQRRGENHVMAAVAKHVMLYFIIKKILLQQMEFIPYFTYAVGSNGQEQYKNSETTIKRPDNAWCNNVYC